VTKKEVYIATVALIGKKVVTDKESLASTLLCHRANSSAP